MKKVFWSDNFNHDYIYKEYYNYSNLSTHENNGSEFLTLNGMLVSKSLQYEKTNLTFNNNYTINKTIENNCFVDNKAFDMLPYRTGTWDTFGTTSRASSAKSMEHNGLGYFKISTQNSQLLLPFNNLAMENGKYEEIQFEFENEVWILKYGWILNGIFVFNVYQKTGNPILFKISFDARYYAQTSVSNPSLSDYSSNRVISKTINLGSNNFNLYTHSHKFGLESESPCKINYTIIPFNTLNTTEQPFVNNYYINSYRYNPVRQYYGYPYYTYGYTYSIANINNQEQVESTFCKYGCTVYLNWGKDYEGRLLEMDFQDFITNDLQLGANFKLCDYNNDIPMFNMIGSRETKEIDIKQVSVCKESKIYWEGENLDLIKVDVNVSFDNGINWTGWSEVENNGIIPQLIEGLNLTNTFVRIKETLKCENNKILPKLTNIKFEILPPTLKYLIVDDNTIKTYIRKYDWVESIYNCTGYMESDTFPDTYVCKASSTFNEYYKAFKAFNHTNQHSYDCWATQNGRTSGELIYDFGEENKKRLYKYFVESRNNPDVDSAPKNWELYVSTDEINWVLVDTQIDQINWKQKERREYLLTPTELIRYVKLKISNNNGNKSTLTVGQLGFYSLEYKVIDEYWEILNNIIEDDLNKKSTYDEYGFMDIDTIQLDKVFELNNPELYCSINNLFYVPHIDIEGFYNTGVRYSVQFKDNSQKLKDWSDFKLGEIRDSSYIDPRRIYSTKPKTIQIISEARKGDIVTKEMDLKITANKPVITAYMRNNRLFYNISDIDNNQFRYHVKVNNKIHYPILGEYTHWTNNKISNHIDLMSDDVNLNLVNVITIFAENQFGVTNKLMLSYIGDYGNIVFYDENKELYTDDFGKILKYLNFDIINAGKYTDAKKVYFKNKNGYPIKNIKLSTIKLYDNVFVEFSFSNNPFIPHDELYFTKEFQPNEESSFYVRINTTISDEAMVSKLPVIIKADPS